MTALVSLEILLLDLLFYEPQLKNHMYSVIIEMSPISVSFIILLAYLSVWKCLVNQVYYLDQCQKYNTIKKEVSKTSKILDFKNNLFDLT